MQNIEKRTKIKTNEKDLTDRRFWILCISLASLLVVTFFVSFVLGRYSGISIGDVFKILINQIVDVFEQTWEARDVTVVTKLRLPRILASILVGAALAISGATYQALFANPMASPDTLGVSSGSGLGACFGILLGWSSAWISSSAFIIGVVAVLFTLFVSMLISRGKNSTVFLVLIGMVISSFLSAIISIIKYVADPEDQLPEITYWLMGSFSGVDMKEVLIFLVLFLIGFVPLLLIRWRMNLLSLSYYEVRSLGENVNVLRVICIICATLLTAASVAISGGIGWVGLVVPHIVRIIVGNDFRRILPASALMGSVYLLIMDDISRCMFASEIPIGILTSVIGVPVFFVILILYRRNLVDGT